MLIQRKRSSAGARRREKRSAAVNFVYREINRQGGLYREIQRAWHSFGRGAHGLSRPPLLSRSFRTTERWQNYSPCASCYAMKRAGPTRTPASEMSEIALSRRTAHVHLREVHCTRDTFVHTTSHNLPPRSSRSFVPFRSSSHPLCPWKRDEEGGLAVGSRKSEEKLREKKSPLPQTFSQPSTRQGYSSFIVDDRSRTPSTGNVVTGTHWLHKKADATAPSVRTRCYHCWTISAAHIIPGSLTRWRYRPRTTNENLLVSSSLFCILYYVKPAPRRAQRQTGTRN